MYRETKIHLHSFNNTDLKSYLFAICRVNPLYDVWGAKGLFRASVPMSYRSDILFSIKYPNWFVELVFALHDKWEKSWLKSKFQTVTVGPDINSIRYGMSAQERDEVVQRIRLVMERR